MTDSHERWSRGFYRLILRGYPRGFRDRYGTEMEAAFAASLRLNARSRWVAIPRCWIAPLVDLARFRRGASGRRDPVGRPQSVEARTSLLESIGGDLRFAMRNLRAAPGFTAIALVTLALGIGGNTAIFSVVDAALLDSLPYHRPEELVAINITLRDSEWWSASLSEIRAWRELNQVFDEIGFARPVGMSLDIDGEPQQINSVHASANLFDTLGIRPALGRSFSAADGVPGAPSVALLTHAAWQQRFAAQRDVVGTRVRLDGVEVEIAGVLPAAARLDFLAPHDLYLPLQLGESDWSNPGKIYAAVGRLRPAVDLAAGRADMDRVARRIELDNPEAATGWGVRLVPLQEQITGPVRSLLLLLLGSVGFVLLVACANTANLMLARGTDRQREFAVRLALGASRGRLQRQLLVEAALLAALGGGGGLLLAAWGTEAVLALSPSRLPGQADVGIDGRVLAFTTLATVGAGLLFGLVPAHRSSRTSTEDVLDLTGGRTTVSAGVLRLRGVLVALELALVVVLLSGASLTLRSLLALMDVDPGFEVQHRVAVRINLPQAAYPTPEDADRLFSDLVERVTGLPGVERAATVSNLPFASTAGFTGRHILDGRPLPPPGEEPIGGVEAVSAGYFEAMGIPLLRGRTIEANDDRPDASPVVVINEALWKQFWPDGDDPLGERLLFARPSTTVPASVSVPREIVGVVGGVKYGLGSEVRPRAYTPSSHMPFAAHNRQLVIEAGDDRPEEVMPQVRLLLRELDPGLPLGEARTLIDWRDNSVATERFQAVLFGLFAAVAVLLGAVGVYGVVSYSVGQRRREVGIRLALGAGRDAICTWVLRGALGPVTAGLTFGTLGALALSRLMEGLLYGIEPTDPLTFVSVPLVLLLVAAAASVAPALRALRADPLDSLRCE